MNGEREGRGRAVQERGAGYEWRVVQEMKVDGCDVGMGWA